MTTRRGLLWLLVVVVVVVLGGCGVSAQRVGLASVAVSSSPPMMVVEPVVERAQEPVVTAEPTTTTVPPVVEPPAPPPVTPPVTALEPVPTTVAPRPLPPVPTTVAPLPIEPVVSIPSTTSTTLNPAEVVWFKDSGGFCFRALRASLRQKPDPSCPGSGRASGLVPVWVRSADGFCEASDSGSLAAGWVADPSCPLG